MSDGGAQSGLELAPRRFGRGRLAFFAGLQRACAAVGGRAFYRRRFLAAGRFEVRRETVVVPALDPALDGFRLVQLSDPHAGPFLGAGDLAAVVDASNALEPDVVVLTGDLITHEPDEAWRLLGDVERLVARRGKFGVFGNHDYRGRREREVAARFDREAGLRFLLDESIRFGDGPGAVALVGLEDLEEARRVDVAGARAGVRAGDVEVVLCHNPAGAPALARAGCAVVLCGHTHGHQIDLPLVRRLAPPHPGDRVRLGATEVITSRGLGALGVPLRVGARAEIVVVDLRRESGGDAR